MDTDTQPTECAECGAATWIPEWYDNGDMNGGEWQCPTCFAGNANSAAVIEWREILHEIRREIDDFTGRGTSLERAERLAHELADKITQLQSEQ
jgi:hypothetical protein